MGEKGVKGDAGRYRGTGGVAEAGGNYPLTDYQNSARHYQEAEEK